MRRYRPIMVFMSLLLTAAAPALAQQVTETIVLNDGQTIEGRMVRGDSNTVIIREAQGGVFAIPADTIQAIYIPPPSPEHTPVLGVFLGWKDGAYDLLVNYKPVRVENGTITPQRTRPVQAPIIAASPARPDLSSAPGRSTVPPPPAAGQNDPQQDPPDVLQAAAAPAASDAEADVDADAEQAAEPAAVDGKVLVNVTITEAREGETLLFQINLSKPAETDLAVIYTTIDGTALGDQDYQPLRGVLSIPPGSSSAQIEASTIDDQDAESEEFFALFLSADPEAVTLPDGLINARILDND